MVTFSKLKPILSLVRSNQGLMRAMSDHHTFPMQPSRWQWLKFKDLFHFYVMLGVIPCTLAITLANVFIGPATLSEIPEGYEPKHWEYYRSPVTRFIARYMRSSIQQDYEKNLAYLFMENEKRQLRKIEFTIKEKIQERGDYKAYYYRPVLAKYHRISKEAYDYAESIRGD